MTTWAGSLATVVAVTVAVVVSGSPCKAEGAASPRRFALVIGNNIGEPPAEDLRFAEDDARKLASVLIELGGYRAEDVNVLTGSKATSARAAFDAVERKLASVKRQGHHATLLVYYSGHARDGDLWMGGSRLPMTELRARLSRSTADVRIGIVDACEAGALTRLKGGRRGPSFLFEPDDRAPAQGLILISSSADNESSQESDVLGGSFFTHYLTSGLRGDADESGEGRVTLGEAYAYAYHRTVAVTAGTRSGPQHPTYRFDLEGQADVVLTDVSQGRSGVVFPAPLAGRYLVFDRARARVAAEIDKKADQVRRLALPVGRYVIKKRMSDHLLTESFELPDGHFHWVDDGRMDRVAFEDDPVKGLRRAIRWNDRPTEIDLYAVVVVQGFLTTSARENLFPTLPLYGLAFEVGPILDGQVRAEVLFGRLTNAPFVLDGLRLRQDFWQLESAVQFTWGGRIGAFAFYGGPRLAGQYVQRRFPGDPILSNTVQDHFGFSPAVAFEARWHALRWLSFGVTARMGLLLFGVDDNRALPYGTGGFSLGVTP